jgi:hypothetical protein
MIHQQVSICAVGATGAPAEKTIGNQMHRAIVIKDGVGTSPIAARNLLHAQPKHQTTRQSRSPTTHCEH